MSMLRKQEYSFLQALYLTHMRKIFPNMQIRRLSSLSQSSTQEDAVSSVTVNSFFLLRKQRNRKSFLLKINVGDKVEGVVKNVTDFGAFIDLGGADGLLHISEMSWGRVENPKKVFNVGDKVTVLIKDINGDKIALSPEIPGGEPMAYSC